jgi:hypothetical protein
MLEHMKHIDCPDRQFLLIQFKHNVKRRSK